MNSFVTELKKQHADFMKKQKKAVRFTREEREQVTEDERYWTDASKYANEYYGDVYKQTTRFDNDWG